MDRVQTLQHFADNPDVQVLIIGGGVNGISAFRDLAMQGVSVLLVERGDFCSGASAASSHMAHGGIRYLENGEFRLVREAVAERNRLIRNAPHYVKPLPTLIPIFKWFSGLLNAPFKFMGLLNKPDERGALVIKIGLIFYDAFTGKNRDVPRHVFRSREESLAQFPQINPKVISTACYYDGLIEMPERLCIEMITDAMEASGDAHALNYVSASGVGDGSITLTDELTGKTIAVKPRAVINAAGPWIDLANAQMGQKTAFIGGTKGSHIVVRNDALREAIGDNEFFFEHDDGRIVLICPLFDRVILGTSDIRIDDPEQVEITEEEIDYFLGMTRKVFPDIAVERSQIVFAFTGVRPLPAAPDHTYAAQISRDHSIREMRMGDIPILNLIGGKWTSHRAFGEQAADRALDLLGCARRQSTAAEPVGGGRDYQKIANDLGAWSERVAHETGVGAERIRVLFERYGSRAERFAREIARIEDDEPLRDAPGYSRGEVAAIVLLEQVQHIDDFLLRRSSLAIRGLVTRGLLEDLASIVAETLQWSKAEQRAEIERAAHLLTSEHRMTL